MLDKRARLRKIVCVCACVLGLGVLGRTVVALDPTAAVGRTGLRLSARRCAQFRSVEFVVCVVLEGRHGVCLSRGCRACRRFLLCFCRWRFFRLCGARPMAWCLCISMVPALCLAVFGCVSPNCCLWSQLEGVRVRLLTYRRRGGRVFSHEALFLCATTRCDRHDAI